MVLSVRTVTWSQPLSHTCGRTDYSSIHASQSFNGFRAQLLKMYKRDRHRMILLWIFYEQVWVHAVCLKQKTAQFATSAGSVLCLVFKASEKSWARKATKQRHGRDTTIYEMGPDSTNMLHSLLSRAVIQPFLWEQIWFRKQQLSPSFFIGYYLGVAFVS